ncbi:MAG: hypothetical protein ACE5GM_03805 [bacterium]
MSNALRRRFHIPPLLFFYLLIIALTGGGFQWWGYSLIAKGRTVPALAAYLFLPAVTLLIMPHQKERKLVYNLLIILVLVSVLLGIIGTIGWIFALVLSGIALNPLDSVREYSDYLNLKASRQEIMKDILLEQDRGGKEAEKGELAPYVDILHGKDMELKLSVIEKLSLEPGPKRVSMLKTALRDSDNEVRLSAANGLRKIEDRFQQKIIALKKECRLLPANDQFFAELGITYDDYAYCGILDRETSRYYQELAIKALAKAISINPFGEDYYKNLGRTMIRINKAKKAIRVLEQGLKLNPDSQAIKTWLAEYYFKQKMFDKVKKLAREIKVEQLPNERIQHSISWWGHG